MELRKNAEVGRARLGERMRSGQMVTHVFGNLTNYPEANIEILFLLCRPNVCVHQFAF